MVEEIPWYSISWFTGETFRSASFQWGNPWALYLLFAIPLVILLRYLLTRTRKDKIPVAFTRAELRSSSWAYLRFLPTFMLLTALVLLIIALARPQFSNERVDQWTEGIDIMLAIDVSESMQGQDLQPDRLEAAKRMAEVFIEGRIQDRIGLVVFAGEAYSLAPLTTDYKMLKDYLREINFKMIQTSGTAIGSALAVMTNRMRESNSKSRVGILLSDGDNNAGNIDPNTASDLASSYGITVYTILVGRDGPVPYGTDAYGQPLMKDNSVDETTLRKIASMTGGEFFRATDNKTLKSVFNRIDQYEKAEIKESRYQDTRDLYPVYLRWAMVFLTIWIILKSSFIVNPIRD